MDVHGAAAAGARGGRGGPDRGAGAGRLAAAHGRRLAAALRSAGSAGAGRRGPPAGAAGRWPLRPRAPAAEAAAARPPRRLLSMRGGAGSGDVRPGAGRAAGEGDGPAGGRGAGEAAAMMAAREQGRGRLRDRSRGRVRRDRGRRRRWRAFRRGDRRNVVRAALYLVVTLTTVAGVYLLLAAEFVAWVQILIYVGAIVILLLFALMLTKAPIGRETLDNQQRGVAFLVALGDPRRPDLPDPGGVRLGRDRDRPGGGLGRGDRVRRSSAGSSCRSRWSRSCCWRR